MAEVEEKIVVSFEDEETLWAMIEIDKDDLDRVRELLERYKADNEELDIDEFLDQLEAEEIGFDEIPTEADVKLDF